MNFIYSDANSSSKQLCTCIKVQVRWYQVTQGGKLGALVICRVGVKGSVTPYYRDFTRATTTCARPEPLPKTKDTVLCVITV